MNENPPILLPKLDPAAAAAAVFGAPDTSPTGADPSGANPSGANPSGASAPMLDEVIAASRDRQSGV